MSGYPVVVQKPAQPTPSGFQTGIKYEPRRKGDRTVLRPQVSGVKFLSSDGIVMTIWLPDVDLQTGGIFTFPPNLHDVGDKRIAGDPLATLPSRLGHLLGQSATPLFLFTEFVSHIDVLPDHEGPGPVLDIVGDQQAHVAMQTMDSQGHGSDQNNPYLEWDGSIPPPVSLLSGAHPNVMPNAPPTEEQRRAFDEMMKQQRASAADATDQYQLLSGGTAIRATGGST